MCTSPVIETAVDINKIDQPLMVQYYSEYM